MLINHSNHLYSNWASDQQLKAIELFGDTVDLPFPAIDPHWDMDRVHKEAMNHVSYLVNSYTIEFKKTDLHVLIAGEQSYLIAFYLLARQHGIHCYVASSERNVVENSPNNKSIQFNFIQFRKIN